MRQPWLWTVPKQSNDVRYCKVCKAFRLDVPTAEMLGWPRELRKWLVKHRRIGFVEWNGAIRSLEWRLRECIEEWMLDSINQLSSVTISEFDPNCAVCRILDQLAQVALHAQSEPPSRKPGYVVKLRRIVIPEYRESLNRESLVFVVYEERENAKSLVRCCRLVKNSLSRTGDDEPNPEIIELYSQKGTRSPFAACPQIIPLSRSLDDSSCFAWLALCVSSCQQLHPTCAQSEPVALPTRLIDVGRVQGTESCRLHVSTDGELGYYAALSHCWGDPSTVPKTLSASLKSFQVEIPQEILSKTFRDAIRITRELGIRYLWIDALCILQDSANDWVSESARMSSIYGGAYLTISATSARDGTEGCLNLRQSRSEVPLFEAQGSINKLYARMPRRHELLWHLKTGQNSGPDKVQPPTFTRKWCFQERILSRRVVHYTREELLWECMTEVRCECKLGEGADAFQSAITMKSRLQDISSKWGEEVVGLYKKIVGLYSVRNVTHATDVLPAFSAIARRFAARGMGRYCAGLWESYLTNLLCWRINCWTNYDRSIPFASAQYCGPSWSWVSVQRPIEYDRTTKIVKGRDDSQDAQILRVSCQKSTDDDFGSVHGADLELVACAIRSRISKFLEIENVSLLILGDWTTNDISLDSEYEIFEGLAVWVVCIWDNFCLLLRSHGNGTFRRIGWYRGNASEPLIEAVHKAQRRTFVIV